MYFYVKNTYLCHVRKFFYILSLLLGLFLFIPNDIQQAQNKNFVFAEQESVWKEGITDWEHHLEIISNDLQNSNCLALRRSSQTISPTSNLRLHRTELKVLHFFNLRKINLQRKISEEICTHQTINFSSLLCRMGYHVYGLRKIII